ncbi:porin [Psychromonas sp. MME2]|uniref:porin n=1 Tax=unclassified Psychromonas TaxID=2614957 RepID=UPI00339C5057
MKKTILAASVAALCSISAQAANVYNADGVSADVYGRMQFDIKNDDGDTDGVGSARMGYNASSVITSDLKAVAKGEWQIDAESEGDSNESKFTARHLYVGVASAEYGQVVFGQSDTAFYQAVAATDIFNTYGYEAFTAIEDGRQPGQIIYNGSFDGFYVGASYQFQDDNYTFQIGNPDNPEDVNDAGQLDGSYALTLGYEFDFGLAVYGGYHLEEFQNDDKHNYALSAAYTINELYLGAVFAMADYDSNKLYGYDFVASYDLSELTTGLSVYTGYATQDAQDGWETLAGTDSPTEALKLGLQYKLNSNAKTWIEFRNDSSDVAKDANEEQQVTAAIQYNF